MNSNAARAANTRATDNNREAKNRSADDTRRVPSAKPWPPPLQNAADAVTPTPASGQ